MSKNSPSRGSDRAPSAVERHAAELQGAMVHHRKGNLKEAEDAYRRLLLVDPNQASVVRLLGVLMMNRGEIIQATGLFERALRLSPKLVEAHVGLGNTLAIQGKFPEAEAAYKRALALDAKHLEALNNLGNVLQQMRRFVEASTTLREAIAINPKLAELHNNLGNALQAEKKPDAAIAAYREAIALKSDFPEAHSNLGNMLKAENKLREALESYRRALELNPRYIDALNNMGNTLHADGRPAEAIAAYRRSQELDPAQGTAYYYEALVHLALGDLEIGFAQYEYRWKSELKHARRGFSQPLWLGKEELAGRSILLHAEQGLGDTLQFVRYASLVAGRGAKVFLEVQPPLKALLKSVPGVQAVFGKGEALPVCDFHCPLLSLPHAFRTTLDTVPPPLSSLAYSTERVDFWRERLASRVRPRIGLMWTGNPHHVNDRNRSVSLELLRPLVECGQGSFYSLQKDYRSQEERLRAVEMGVVDLSAEVGDLESTAALVANMDVVISVDTSMAHLAGSMGRPTWILLPFCPDWRWLLQRQQTPWYPSTRLFRQEQPGVWTQPVQGLVDALKNFATQ